MGQGRRIKVGTSYRKNMIGFDCFLNGAPVVWNEICFRKCDELKKGGNL